MRLKSLVAFVMIGLGLGNLSALADEMEDFPRWYLGTDATLVLPQGGAGLRRLGGGAFSVGYYATETLAVEGSAALLEDRAGLAMRGLWHWRGWHEYDLLFGYSRIDPFFTFGVRGWMPLGQVGPDAGIGALYYLSDNWALRAETDATLGLNTSVGCIYTFTLGVQYSF